MPTFGPVLRRTREEREIPLDVIARETRLSKRYLQALEDEAIGKLPGGTYNRAYLRTYATFLGLEPDGLLRDYANEEARQSGATEQDLLATMNRTIERRDRAGTDGPLTRAASHDWGRIAGMAGLAAVVVAALAGVTWLGVSYFNQPEVVNSLPDAMTSRAPVPAVRPTALDAAVAPAPLESPAPLEPPVTPAAAPIDTPHSVVTPDARHASNEGALSHLAVTGSGVGTAVVDRQLVGQGDQFAVGSRVVFWTHVVGGRAGDTIDHVWFRDGSLVGAASLSVGSPDWRTQSRRVLDPPGHWAVEARDADGRVLARHEFHASPE